MAVDKKISNLTALTTPTTSDILTILDVSDTADTNKQITLANIKTVLGDVNGPGSSTDTAIALWDGATGELLKDSVVTIDGAGSINIPTGQDYKINGTALAYTDITSAISLTEAKAIKIDDFATADDNTDLDATVTEHGLLPKLGGGTSNFLRADGTWVNPNAASVEDADFTAKGELVSASAASTTGQLSVGTNGQYIVAASGETLGMKWDDRDFPRNVYVQSSAAYGATTTHTITHNLGVSQADVEGGRYKVVIAERASTALGYLLGDQFGNDGSWGGAAGSNAPQVYYDWDSGNPADRTEITFQANSLKFLTGASGLSAATVIIIQNW